jgi:predicted PurR-regulated permease PerM
LTGPAPPELNSPIEPRSIRARTSFQTAFIWIGTAALFWLAWQLAEALLLLFAGLVFAAGLRSGTRALGRIVNLPHGVRLAIVVVLVLGGLFGFLAFAGVTLAAQAQTLLATLEAQVDRLADVAQAFGIDLFHGTDAMGALQGIIEGNFDRLAAFIGSTLGGLGAMLLVVTLGVYVAAEPQLYERGLEWLTPVHSRARLHAMLLAMSLVLQRWVVGRLVTMGIEGGLTFVGLTLIGMPLAGVLALVAGLLAFIPNIGAMVAGALIVAVGFSVSPAMGLWALGLYAFIQFVDGNVLNPLVEKHAVDLAPAVVLAAQLLFGILFGLLGVALADPIVALAKVALERRGIPMEPRTPSVR